MAIHIIHWTRKQVSRVHGATMAEAIENLKDNAYDYEDTDAEIQVDEAASTTEDPAIFRKAIIKALAESSMPLSMDTLLDNPLNDSSETEDCLQEAVFDLHSEGILLKKRATGRYFICAAGQARAQEILRG